MVIVKLSDGTSYLIDTDDESLARDVVKTRLADRIDHRYRKGMTTEVFEGVTLEKWSPYYNSSNRFDSVSLKCRTGWSYK